jgi:hypothetical protein
MRYSLVRAYLKRRGAGVGSVGKKRKMVTGKIKGTGTGTGIINNPNPFDSLPCALLFAAMGSNYQGEHRDRKRQLVIEMDDSGGSSEA